MTVYVAVPNAEYRAEQYIGLSGDTKPTLGTLEAGSTFDETDTGTVYKWSGTAWYVAASSGSVSVSSITAGNNHIGQVGGQVIWAAADATITRPNNTTAYAAHQAIGDAGNCIFKFSNFLRVNGGSGILTLMRLEANKASIATTNMGNIRAHIFNASPSSPPSADQATYTTLVANSPARLGFVDFSTWNIGGTGSDVITSYGQVFSSASLQLVGNATHRDLYVVLEATAAFTPIASAIINIYMAAELD